MSSRHAAGSSNGHARTSLFPLPYFDLPHRICSVSRGLVSRRHQLRAAFTTANTCILSLNLLYLNCSLSALPVLPRVPASRPQLGCSVSSSFSNSTSSYSLSQYRILDHLFRSARRFVAESRLRGNSLVAGQVGTSTVPVPLLQQIRQFVELELTSNHQLSLKADATSSSSIHPSSSSSSAGSFQSSSPYSFPCSALPIVADRVSLPDVPQKVNMLDLLPPLMQQLYSTPDKLLLPASPSGLGSSCLSSPSVRPRVFGSKAEYYKLIRRMYRLGMVSFRKTPKCVNGIFAVRKEGTSLRLIIDARLANALFIRPPGVRLPDPSSLVNISIPADETLYVAKNDIKDFYHSILLPEWLVPYFGLPAVTLSDLGLPGDALFGADDMIHPVCLTVPMGWSHAVLVAQIDHENVLYRSGALRSEHNLLTMLIATPFLPPNTAAHTVYIDDGPTFATSHDACLDAHLSMQDCYVENKLQAKLSKCERPTSEAIDVLGLEWNGKEHTVGASVSKLKELCVLTLRHLKNGRATGLQLSRLIGSWVWPLLVRRPGLSVLRHVYRFIHCSGRRCYVLWPSVRRELLMLVGLAPLLYVDVSAPFCSSVFASDASSTGGGVVSTPLSAELADGVWPLTCLPQHSYNDPTRLDSVPLRTLSAAGSELLPDIHSLQPSLASAFHVSSSHVNDVHDTMSNAPWSTIASWKWKHLTDSHSVPMHINQLELQAVLTVVKRVATSRAGINSRVLLGIDSTVALHVLRRGRTSSHQLYPVTCRINALCLATGIRLHSFWIPSEHNPADKPSRQF
jgi:hypothetical protein